MDVLKILGNAKRRSLLRILINQNMHISALARELGLSVPVTLKHINLLESAGLVERKPMGNTVIIQVKEDTVDMLKRLEDIIEKPAIIHAEKGTRLSEALSVHPGIMIKKSKNGNYIASIDNIPGYYIFKLNDRLTDKSIDRCVLYKDTTIEFQRLVPVLGSKVKIKIE